MKSLKIWLLFLTTGIHVCKAQDTTLLLSPAMFDKTTDQIHIGAKDGWFFKEGNDTAWAKINIDITGWKKMKPADFSVKLADKNGKAEGWFRIKIKLDESFTGIPLGLNTSSWAASDVYLDGRWLRSAGNTGSTGEPYKENRVLYNQPVQIQLSPGKEYTIALHVVDYVSSIPPNILKSEELGFPPLVVLTGPDFVKLQDVIRENRKSYPLIWSAVCSVLCLLFWLLYAQNSTEKNLQLISLCISFLTLHLLGNVAWEYFEGLSFTHYKLIFLGTSLTAQLNFILIPLILANVFKGKASVGLKTFLVLILILQIISFFIPHAIPYTLLLSIIVAVCIYYVVNSLKTLRGAQWAIVAGLVLTLFWVLIYTINNDGTTEFPFAALYASGIYLSFPLSLLVYVSLRFKEIIKEVRENAEQVVQLSEEKKEQALYQQKILQEEVYKQTAEIRTALDNLKATQSQLIQSEKMASLGELTAGIAHEIQNPLNFVNNFSEINAELSEEILDAAAKGDLEEVKSLASNIKSNQEKIREHGKRADSIVKGMLQHSRSSTGVKEPTDISAMADEYLRLAYHGMRAKDKSFNATIKTDFDPQLPLVPVVSQDIGRVLLNLFNNAFYAVQEKAKTAGPDYQPMVMVTIGFPEGVPPGKESDNPLIRQSVMVRVADNGPGIPETIKDKIFQPFFTTKPTGQGTGLGLSLSYDIVKAHGGELKVETKEGSGTVFSIQLPYHLS